MPFSIIRYEEGEGGASERQVSASFPTHEAALAEAKELAEAVGAARYNSVSGGYVVIGSTNTLKLIPTRC